MTTRAAQPATEETQDRLSVSLLDVLLTAWCVLLGLEYLSLKARQAEALVQRLFLLVTGG